MIFIYPSQKRMLTFAMKARIPLQLLFFASLILSVGLGIVSLVKFALLGTQAKIFNYAIATCALIALTLLSSAALIVCHSVRAKVRNEVIKRDPELSQALSKYGDSRLSFFVDANGTDNPQPRVIALQDSQDDLFWKPVAPQGMEVNFLKSAQFDKPKELSYMRYAVQKAAIIDNGGGPPRLPEANFGLSPYMILAFALRSNGCRDYFDQVLTKIDHGSAYSLEAVLDYNLEPDPSQQGKTIYTKLYDTLVEEARASASRALHR